MVFIDLSSSSSEDDNDDCLILSSSGLSFACTSKQNEEMAPLNQAVSPRSSKREEATKKEDQVVLISAAAADADADAVSQNKRRRRRGPEKKEECEVDLIPAGAAAAASHNKRRRRAGKKKEDEVALIPVATAAAPKKIEIAEKKKKPLITVNKKIPQGHLTTVTPKRTRNFNMHKSLAGKKVLIYGLPGVNYPVVDFNLEDIAEKSKHWRPFYQNRVKNPALEFLKQADHLKANGVDEILFFCVNGNALMFAYKTLDFMKRYESLKFISDYEFRYMDALGIEMDIPQKGMPPRSRRFILLVDNLKVKVANIESSDENFTIPSAEEIIKAFGQ